MLEVRVKLPEKGRTKDEILDAMRAMRTGDADWRGGRTFSLVYYAGDDVLALLHDAFFLFFSENALNPMAFPSLRRFETEVVSMVADLLGAPDAVGSLTSGGTESILMAVKTARDRARAERPGLAAEMVVPVTAHPAFMKAAHYFDVKPILIPVDDGFRADVTAACAAMNDRTVLVVGSAPSYPQGVVDPIPALAAAASARGIPCHVDACLGGMLLPFARRLGYPIPPFDFAVPGVTSMSCDLHKYGYAAKGASTVLYRTRELRRHQFVAYADWPGGLYGSPTAAGTRPGGPIAAAWAVMSYLGEEGYLRLAKATMETARALIEGIDRIDGLHILGRPDISVFGFASDKADVYALGDEMSARGWHLDRQQRPPSLHMMITPAHAKHVAAILEDLAAAARKVEGGLAAEGSGAMYGMLGSLPDRSAAKDFILDFMDAMDRT
jgi:glutamate/tyrosine decarboxylase-like PLP-dependent enzyme